MEPLPNKRAAENKKWIQIGHALPVITLMQETYQTLPCQMLILLYRHISLFRGTYKTKARIKREAPPFSHAGRFQRGNKGWKKDAHRVQEPARSWMPPAPRDPLYLLIRNKHTWTLFKEYTTIKRRKNSLSDHVEAMCLHVGAIAVLWGQCAGVTGSGGFFYVIYR